MRFLSESVRGWVGGWMDEWVGGWVGSAFVQQLCTLRCPTAHCSNALHFAMPSALCNHHCVSDASRTLRPHVALASDVQREIERSTAFHEQLKTQRRLNAEKARKNNSRIQRLLDLGYEV